MTTVGMINWKSDRELSFDYHDLVWGFQIVAKTEPQLIHQLIEESLTMQILAKRSERHSMKGNILMKEIKLSISDKALVTLRDLVFGSMLGDNYGGCHKRGERSSMQSMTVKTPLKSNQRGKKMREPKRVKNSNETI